MIRYGPLAATIIILGLLVNGWITLASSPSSALGNSSASNYLYVSIFYSILALAGGVLFLAPFSGFKYVNRSAPLAITEFTLAGVAMIFAVVSLTGLIEISSPFKIFAISVQSALGSTSFPTQGLVSNPFFYSFSIFEDGAIEDSVFLPFYNFLRNTGGNKPGTTLAANGVTGITFAILHYVKEVLIYGWNLPLAAWLFLISAFFVRIGLNLLMQFTKYATPSMLAHGAFDFIVTIFSGISI